LSKAYLISSFIIQGELLLNIISISHIKKEIRVIGVAAKKIKEEYIVIGTIFRGNIIFDGVISNRGYESLSEIIIAMINGSKHYGQLRTIILDETALPETVDPYYIWEQTEKPVLLVKKDNFFDPRYMFRYKKRVVKAAGLLEKTARRLMDVVFTPDGSEAIRLSVNILRGIS
jgi:hypothetical protein